MKQLELFPENLETEKIEEKPSEEQSTFYKYDCWASNARCAHVCRCNKYYENVKT